MFKNTFQSGFLSVLYSIGSKPLQLWDKIVRNGHIKRITDNDIQVKKKFFLDKKQETFKLTDFSINMKSLVLEINAFNNSAITP